MIGRRKFLTGTAATASILPLLSLKPAIAQIGGGWLYETLDTNKWLSSFDDMTFFVCANPAYQAGIQCILPPPEDLPQDWQVGFVKNDNGSGPILIRRENYEHVHGWREIALTMHSDHAVVALNDGQYIQYGTWPGYGPHGQHRTFVYSSTSGPYPVRGSTDRGALIRFAGNNNEPIVEEAGIWLPGHEPTLENPFVIGWQDEQDPTRRGYRSGFLVGVQLHNMQGRSLVVKASEGRSINGHPEYIMSGDLTTKWFGFDSLSWTTEFDFDSWN